MFLAAVIATVLGTSGVASAALIEGTDQQDFLSGTRHRDVIYGLAGVDYLSGLGRNDVLFGGRGDDNFNLSASSHHVDRGHDVFFGGKGNDDISSFGDATRASFHLRDYVFCGRGRDTVYADRLDFVWRDCERIFRGIPPRTPRGL